jgi:hypothetical protein
MSFISTVGVVLTVKLYRIYLQGCYYGQGVVAQKRDPNLAWVSGIIRRYRLGGERGLANVADTIGDKPNADIYRV